MMELKWQHSSLGGGEVWAVVIDCGSEDFIWRILQKL